MFVFNRSSGAVAAGLGVALLTVALERLCEPPEASPERAALGNMTAALVRDAPPAVSSAPVRDLSLSCRLPPASFASWLPSVKSRIVPDQVAARAPETQVIFGQHSC